jgi:hypothetical protein
VKEVSEEEKKEEEIKEENEVKEEEEEEREEEEREEEEELTDADIKELAKNANREEAKYFLELSTWSRPGNSFTDWGKVRVIEGEIKMIEKERIYNYPTTDETKYLILPLTRTVILIHSSYNDYNGDNDVEEVLYVFSAREGWRSLRL